MSSKKRQNILFIWDKLKTIPTNGKYWVMMGLALSSEWFNVLGNQPLRFLMLLILGMELINHIYYEFSSQTKLDYKDMKRAENLYFLMEEEDNE